MLDERSRGVLETREQDALAVLGRGVDQPTCLVEEHTDDRCRVDHDQLLLARNILFDD